MQGIPTLALSKSGSRSEVIPPSQPVTQAPVFFIYFSKTKRSRRFGSFRLFHVICDVAQGIPTLALSKSGSRSEVKPPSQPVAQAPVPIYLYFINKKKLPIWQLPLIPCQLRCRTRHPYVGIIQIRFSVEG